MSLKDELSRVDQDRVDFQKYPPTSFEGRIVSGVYDFCRGSADNDFEARMEANGATDWALNLIPRIIQPQSIDEYVDMKRELLSYLIPEKGWQDYSYRKDLVDHVLLAMRIFPRDELGCATFGEAWTEFEEIASWSVCKDGSNIITPKKAIELCKEIHEAGRGRVGHFAGKFRAGTHSGHLDTISLTRRALGSSGVLFVGIESREAILQRIGTDTEVLSDEERLGQMSKVVDYVFLYDPSLGILDYYDEIQRGMEPHLWVVGEEDYEWRDKFAKLSREIGALYLWARPKSNVSTTGLIRQIKGD